MSFYYSLFNKYNSTMLDENNKYYIDNIHPDSEFNNILVNFAGDNNLTTDIIILTRDS